PFVGRIIDCYKAKEGRDFEASEDQGVLSVTNIYNYYKEYGYKTVVMGSIFRNIVEFLELACCELLTIGPALLAYLEA
ncbi:transaldolase, partial [Vibrio parahaemolyticus]|nr:transaldolase [Vibrio parahaemolyticus]